MFLSAAYTPAIPGDTLHVIRQPSSLEAEGGSPPADNRTAVVLGTTIDPPGTSGDDLLLRCVAAHTDDACRIYIHIDWIRNGLRLPYFSDRITILSTDNGLGTQYGADLRITNFTESDAGIYQCMVTNTVGSNFENVTSFPHRLDTGTCTHSITGGCCVGQCSSSGNDAPLSRPCWR